MDGTQAMEERLAEGQFTTSGATNKTSANSQHKNPQKSHSQMLTRGSKRCDIFFVNVVGVWMFNKCIVLLQTELADYAAEGIGFFIWLVLLLLQRGYMI